MRLIATTALLFLAGCSCQPEAPVQVPSPSVAPPAVAPSSLASPAATPAAAPKAVATPRRAPARPRPRPSVDANPPEPSIVPPLARNPQCSAETLAALRRACVAALPADRAGMCRSNASCESLRKTLAKACDAIDPPAACRP